MLVATAARGLEPDSVNQLEVTTDFRNEILDERQVVSVELIGRVVQTSSDRVCRGAGLNRIGGEHLQCGVAVRFGLVVEQAILLEAVTTSPPAWKPRA